MEKRLTLRELREQQEWTQDKLAEIAEVNKQVIQNIEAGIPVSWVIATRITVKVRNYLGKKAIEGLYIPQTKE